VTWQPLLPDLITRGLAQNPSALIHWHQTVNISTSISRLWTTVELNYNRLSLVYRLVFLKFVEFFPHESIQPCLSPLPFYLLTTLWCQLLTFISTIFSCHCVTHSIRIVEILYSAICNIYFLHKKKTRSLTALMDKDTVTFLSPPPPPPFLLR
jgi:hypothetical protein